MDLAPARAGDRSLFPDLAPVAYLNHAGISPPSTAVRAAVNRLLDAYARGGSAAVAEALALRNRLRAKLSALVGASPAELALTAGASHGVQAVALSFPWRAGDRVLLFDGEFPANVTPWQRAAALFDLEVRLLPLAPFQASEAAGLQMLARALGEGARLVAVSAVQFRTGLAMPLAAMSALCHAHGAELCVDAIQAVGATPFDVRTSGVDYAAGGGHKWLMGVEGVGWLFVRRERAPHLHPTLAGWLSHEEAVRFLTDGPGHLRYDRPLRPAPGLFEGSSSALVAQAGLDASLELLLELGLDRVRAHLDAYLDRLEPLLAGRGFRSLRAPEAGRRSGILSAEPPPGVDGPALRDALASEGIVVALPDGLVRFSPHWPNDPDRELPSVAAALDRALARARQAPPERA